MKRKVTAFFIIRVIILLVGIYFYYCYSLEKTLVKETDSFPYKITDVYCSTGKSSSYLKIADKGKTYEVQVSGRQKCASFKQGESVQLYYNHLLDYYFLKEEVSGVKVMMSVIVFGATFLWQIINQYKKEKTNKLL